MDLHALMDTVITSQREEWHKIFCGVAGPSYRDRLSFCSTWNGQGPVLKAESHDSVAVYVPDAAITLAWGLRQSGDFDEDWVRKFPEPRASSSCVDVFFNSALVFREVYASVNGGRANLPLPIPILDGKGELVALHVPKRHLDFIRLVDSLEMPVSQFDSHFRRAGFEVVDTDWPRLWPG